MKVNLMNLNDCQTRSSNQNPNFKKMIHVSNVIIDDKSIKMGTKEYNLIISRAIKFLKDTKNQSLDFVKSFWVKADGYHTKDLHRTADFMATSSHARELTRASHDIKYQNGDKTQYQTIKNMLINDRTNRLRENNIEQELYIKGYSAKRKKIVFEEIGFKNKGEKLKLKNIADISSVSDFKLKSNIQSKKIMKETNYTNLSDKDVLCDKNGQYLLKL